MNSVNIIGNLSCDPKAFGSDDNKVVKFTVAVQRSYTGTNGEKETDFIACTAFKKAAERIDKYLAKGSKVGVTGSLQNNTWTNKDGVQESRTGVIVEQITFLDNKETGESLMARRKDNGGTQSSESKPKGQSKPTEEDPW